MCLYIVVLYPSNSPNWELLFLPILLDFFIADMESIFYSYAPGFD